MQKAEGMSEEKSEVTWKLVIVWPEKKNKVWLGVWSSSGMFYDIMQSFQDSTELSKVQSVTMDGNGVAEWRTKGWEIGRTVVDVGLPNLDIRVNPGVRNKFSWLTPAKEEVQNALHPAVEYRWSLWGSKTRVCTQNNWAPLRRSLSILPLRF